MNSLAILRRGRSFSGIRKSRHYRRIVPINPSQTVLVLSARTGVLRTRMPKLFRAVSPERHLRGSIERAILIATVGVITTIFGYKGGRTLVEKHPQDRKPACGSLVIEMRHEAQLLFFTGMALLIGYHAYAIRQRLPVETGER